MWKRLVADDVKLEFHPGPHPPASQTKDVHVTAFVLKAFYPPGSNLDTFCIRDEKAIHILRGRHSRAQGKPLRGGGCESGAARKSGSICPTAPLPKLQATHRQ